MAVIPSVMRARCRRLWADRDEGRRSGTLRKTAVTRAWNSLSALQRRERGLVEAEHQLGIAGNGFSCIGYAQAHEQGLQLVAEEPEQLEDHPLFAWTAGEQVVHLVEDEHTDINLLQQFKRSCLQLGQGSRALLTAGIQCPQELGIDPTLTRS